MIAIGKLRINGPRLGRYLMKDSKGNERIELGQVRGFVSDDIHEAFDQAQFQAEGTNIEKPFFHCYVRLPDKEALADREWVMVADRIERAMNLVDQPRAIVFHDKEDRGRHMHIAWARLDQETMLAREQGLYKNKLAEVCRELEVEMKLTQVRSDRGPDEPRAAATGEFEMARHLGTDLEAIRREIRGIWKQSDNGQAFNAGLESAGYVLARGDQRPYVAVDREGGYHSIGTRIARASAADIHDRLSDLDPARLPSLAEAKEIQFDRAHGIVNARDEIAYADAIERAAVAVAGPVAVFAEAEAGAQELLPAAGGAQPAAKGVPDLHRELKELHDRHLPHGSDKGTADKPQDASGAKAAKPGKKEKKAKAGGGTARRIPINERTERPRRQRRRRGAGKRVMPNSRPTCGTRWRSPATAWPSPPPSIATVTCSPMATSADTWSSTGKSR